MQSLTAPLLFCALFALIACDERDNQETRWYTTEQVQYGAKIFALNCAACHGNKAQGLAEDWQVPLLDGSYPAPPLDGSAHAWHHDLPLLIEIVQKGGALFNGKMPAFAEQLSEQEQLAAIAWFQNLWSEKTYQLWAVDRMPAHQNGIE